MVKPCKVPPTHEEGSNEWAQYEASGEGGQIDKTKPGKIRYAKKGMASEGDLKARTLTSVFIEANKKVGDKPALMVERPCPPLVKGQPPAPAFAFKDWTKWTYQEMFDECQTAARGYMALGLEAFDAVAIFGFNSPEWVMGELAAIMGGGVAAGIYPTDTPQQVAFKAQHSGARLAICEGQKQADCFLNEAEMLPKLSAVVIWDPELADKEFEDKVIGDRTIKVVHWKTLTKLAEEVPQEQLQARIDAQEPGHVCAYIYTSGTTGNPKAVMISHDNLMYNASCVLMQMGEIGAKGQERVVSFLPLSHVAGMMLDIIAPIAVATLRPGYTTVHFARPYDMRAGSLGDRLRLVKPTLFLGVPRVWEKISEKMKKVGAATTGAKLKAATWAKGKGLVHQKNMQLGGSGDKPWGYALAYMLILSKVKRAMGLECCKFGFTGAAPITKDTLEYFGALGIQINECYGMSESTGVTTWSTDEAHIWGSCGWALNGQEVKVFNVDGEKKVECPRAKDLFKPTEEEQGEICYRGRHIMLGYMANPDLGEEHVAEIRKKTDGALDDEGWLHSGDKGCMDARGMVKITGRYKELIIGAGGENIAPVPIEDNLKAICPAISNVMMVGDKRKFNVCLITLKAKGATGDAPGGGELDGPAAELNPKITTIREAASDSVVLEAIEKAVKDTNSNGDVCPSNASKIQKFLILPFDFSVETLELTPTLKLKRSVVEAKHLAVIDALYDSKEMSVMYSPWPEGAYTEGEEANRRPSVMDGAKEADLVSVAIMNEEDREAMAKIAEAADKKLEEETKKEEE